MAALVAKRLALLIAVLLATTFLAFAAMNVIGDPLLNIVGPAAGIDCDAVETGFLPDGSEATDTDRQQCELVAEAVEEFHLDEPLPSRYALWISDVATGDLGRSFKNEVEVRDIIRDKVPETFILTTMALILSLVISIPWGVYSAYRANRAFDRASTFVSFGMLSIPNFALAVLAWYLLTLRFGIFPSAYDGTDLRSILWSMIVPALSLAIPIAATYQRLLRTDLLTTLQEDYIHMARAKGMPARHIMFRHALRPSMFSVVTVFGVNTGTLIGGALVVENIFGIPGLGREVVTSVIRDDYPTVLGIIVVIAVVFVLVNFVVDLLYTWLDPRVRLS